MLAERIIPDTFHVTLHDLSNGEPSEELWNASERNKTQAEAILKNMKKNGGKFRLRPVAAFNMMNTSIVLGLEPEDDHICLKLMEMYETGHQIVKLNYPMTLHITLGYFKPGYYDARTVHRLKEALFMLNNMPFPEVEISTESLQYQRFDDMNHYYTV